MSTLDDIAWRGAKWSFEHADYILISAGAAAGFGLGVTNGGLLMGIWGAIMLALITAAAAYVEPRDSWSGPHQ